VSGGVKSVCVREREREGGGGGGKLLFFSLSSTSSLFPKEGVETEHPTLPEFLPLLLYLLYTPFPLRHGGGSYKIWYMDE